MRFVVSAAIALSATVFVPVTSGKAAELPQYVKGPVSGFVFDCQEAKQRITSASSFVSSGDLDGDGKPDHVIDSGKGCQANRDLYCNAEGCTINVYLSSTSGLALSIKAKTVAFSRTAGRPALTVTKGGAACERHPDKTCTVTYVNTDGEMKPVP